MSDTLPMESLSDQPPPAADSMPRGFGHGDPGACVRQVHRIRRVASGLLDLAFPPRCACCGAWGCSRALCLDCAKEIGRLRLGEFCPICAGDVGPHEATWDGCGNCRESHLRIMGTTRTAAYRERLAVLVRQYKFHERHDVEPLLVEWLCDSITASPWLPRVEAVTYVPTHWRRTLWGRFHAARSLARAVARRLDLPCAALLQRTRAGPRQVGLSFAQRLENVRGAFSLIPGTSVRGAHILILDDVRTTGATLEECAKALRRGRAAEIYAAVIARARGTDDDLDNA